MPKYLLMSYLPAEGGPTPQDFRDPQVRKAAQDRWKAYDQILREAGVYVDKHPLVLPHNARTVRVRDGEAHVTDGPFAEVKEFFAGYYLIEAPDIDDAVKWAAQMPNTAYGPVEVRPVVPEDERGED